MSLVTRGSVSRAPHRFGTRPPRWRRRLSLLFRGRRIVAAIELATFVAMVVMFAVAWLTVAHSGQPQRPLQPLVVALLLIGNLLPAMALLVLAARRIAVRRALRSPLGGRGQLHVRLVALFSGLAALPTLLVAIFASVLFQVGIQFWFSDSARTVLANADRVAQTYVDEHKSRLAAEASAMKGDLLNWMSNAPPDDPRSQHYFASQYYYRQLDQAALIQIEPNHREELIYGANLDKRSLEQRLAPALIYKLGDGKPQFRVLPDRFEAAIQFDPASHTYLWVSRRANPLVLGQAGRANSALNDYRAIVERSRTLQLQFNLALLVGSLAIVAMAIWVALTLADRLVRPIGELVGAARRVAIGDLAVRVPVQNAQDEVGTLAAAFNRMTRRLQEQTGALESRRALTEAVLSGVSAGVISIDPEGVITIVNPTANALLRTGVTDLIGGTLDDVAPELGELVRVGRREATVQIAVAGELRTLAVTVGRAGEGHVLTFDDITEQLADQRRAAWADVARRIAHEIKNPLTPIQLAAERLERRYGRNIEDDGTFARLVSTIVRQVGDIRRMIDEFSAFARMPKPNFEEADLVEIVRQAVFLHEIAHPTIQFDLDADMPFMLMVCDRRQLGQALTNLVKNAVEAVEARAIGDGEGRVDVRMQSDAGQVVITVADNGIGLPPDRERLTEPYMTTRAKGTGLGLAIVKKIVEEHLGQIGFADRPGGGAVVRLCFEPAATIPLAAGPATSDEETLIASGAR